MATRASGLLLHITSLPSRYGIGDLGPAAYNFADFLADTHQRIWQMLPIGPVGYGASPYSSPSTFAGNPLFISPERLCDQHLLNKDELAPLADLPDGHVDYDRLIPRKRDVLTRAFDRFEAGEGTIDEDEFLAFCEAEADWLDDYALYMALKWGHDEAPWTAWPAPLRRRDPDALEAARHEYARAIRKHRFWQFLFDRQWNALHNYCQNQDIRLFGDVPIYVAHDSADVWANQSLFHLDEDGQATQVAGVPPDLFSETGQRWGNPIYRWDRMRERNYRWWTRRIEHTLRRVDLVRVDHFRGFAAYWSIPAEEETAVAGEWVDGPGADLFNTLQHELGELPIVAEDLGIITPDVVELRDRFDFPGMVVLQFAFGNGPDSDYLPHNYRRNAVAYTGTHDNNTFRGWWNSDKLPEEDREFARSYLGLNERVRGSVHWMGIRAMMASVADRAVFPLQDVLGLDAEARMNTPGSGSENWRWRYKSHMLTDTLATHLADLTYLYGRAPALEDDASDPG